MPELLGSFVNDAPPRVCRRVVVMTFPERTVNNRDLKGLSILSEHDAREATRLLRQLIEALGNYVDPEGSYNERPYTEALASRARIIFQGRKARLRHFNRAMFGEPAWDMMLALYISDIDGERLTATRLADLIEQPFSSVVRWIDYLEKERFIERRQHPTDKRVQQIRLTDKGRRSMEAYLSTDLFPLSGEPGA
jgi:DNA-binding MarR family transcriptional regulator